MKFSNTEVVVKEQKYLIGIEPVIDMEHFVMLLLADLASKSPIKYLDNSNIKTACLSFDYKRIIEEIMFEENGWGFKFAELINISSYYEYQNDYEEKLTIMLKKVCSKLNKIYYFEIEDETIRIDFTKEEIDNIKSMYDKHILDTMNHFSELLSAYCFTRSFNLKMKEYDRHEIRFELDKEDLKLRTKYTEKLKIANPLCNNIKKTNNTLLKKLKKIKQK